MGVADHLDPPKAGHVLLRQWDARAIQPLLLGRGDEVEVVEEGGQDPEGADLARDGDERAEEITVKHPIRDDGHLALVVVKVPRPPLLGPEARAELAAEVEEAALAQGVHKIFVTEAQDSKELVLVNALREALKISA